MKYTFTYVFYFFQQLKQEINTIYFEQIMTIYKFVDMNQFTN